jgi:hypothetical protein
MSYLRSFLVASLLTALALFAPARAADGGLDGWKLAQWSREAGNFEVYICQSGVRMIIPKNGLIVVACAPWQEVSLYCSKTGNIYKTTLPKFRNPYLSTMSIFEGGLLADIGVGLKGPIKIVDIPSKCYVERPGFTQSQLAKFRNGTIASRAPLSVEYIVSDYFKTDPDVGHIMSRFYALPQTGSVPLQFTYKDMAANPGKQLITTSIKSVKLKASDFKAPVGLKVVKEAMAVLVPNSSDGALDLMMMGQSKVK